MDADHDDMLADAAEDHVCREEETRTREAVLAARAAAFVLWHNNEPGGDTPPNFTAWLLNTWDRANPEEHALLALGFPQLAAAVELANAGEYDLLRYTVERATQTAP